MVRRDKACKCDRRGVIKERGARAKRVKNQNLCEIEDVDIRPKGAFPNLVEDFIRHLDIEVVVYALDQVRLRDAHLVHEFGQNRLVQELLSLEDSVLQFEEVARDVLEFNVDVENLAGQDNRRGTVVLIRLHSGRSLGRS